MAMVSEAKVNGSGGEAPNELLPALAEKPVGLPPGKYVLVGWDMDTTGRRLIDEVIALLFKIFFSYMYILQITGRPENSIIA